MRTIVSRSPQRRKAIRKAILIIGFVLLVIGSFVNVYWSLTSSPEPTLATAPGGFTQDWDPAFADLLPNDSLPFWLSAVSGYGFGVIVPGLCLVSLLLVWIVALRAAQKASRIDDQAHEPLSASMDGEQTLFGEIVAIEGEAEEAMRRNVDHRFGKKARSDPKLPLTETSHDYAEYPFTLRLTDGQQVRVEPDRATTLVGNFEWDQNWQTLMRTKRARLVLGDKIYARGMLTGSSKSAKGYRGGGDQLALLPSSNGSLVLSTQPFHFSHRKRARSKRNWLVFFILYTLLATWRLHIDFWMASLYGEPVAGTIVNKKVEEILNS